MIHWTLDKKDTDYHIIACNQCAGRGERHHYDAGMGNGHMRSCTNCNGWGHLKIDVNKLNEFAQRKQINMPEQIMGTPEPTPLFTTAVLTTTN